MLYCDAATGDWGPLGPRTLDLTSCFSEAVLQVVPPLFLFIGGVPRLVYLARKPGRHRVQEKSKERQRIVYRCARYLRLGWTALQVLLSAGLIAAAVRSNAVQNAGVLVSTILSLSSSILALLLEYFEQTVMCAGSTVLASFWLLKWLTGAVSLRTYALLNVQYTDPVYFALCAAIVACALVSSVLEQVQPGPKDGELPELKVSVFSRLTFAWITPLVIRGSRRPLAMDELYETHPKISSGVMVKAFNRQVTRGMTPAAAILWGTLRQHWMLLAVSLGAQCVSLALMLAQPQLVGNLIMFVQSHQLQLSPLPVEYGYFYAVIMVIMAVLEGAFSQQALYKSSLLSIRVRVIYQNVIYHKALRLSAAGDSTASSGQLVSLMSADTTRIAAAVTVINDLWSAVVTVSVATYCLYGLLGPATFASFGAIVVLGGVMAAAGKTIGSYNQAQMENQDARLKLISELIASIKMVKLYASESYFVKRLAQYREKELEAYARMWRIFSGIVAGLNVTALLMVLLSFGTYIAIAPPDAPLDAHRVFVSLNYFVMLRTPLSNLQVIGVTAYAGIVSYRRVVEFLGAPEADPKAATKDTQDSTSSEAISIKDGCFTWASTTADDKSTTSFGSRQHLAQAEASDTSTTLTDINLVVPRGCRMALVGRVGQGKSSMLHAVLGEMIKVSGSVTVKGKVAYVAQQPWITNATVRENITFGQPFNQRQYDTVLAACSLLPDLEILPKGDDTAIGDKGVNLSGGQKARVALARAVYANADIYLIDDCLSAVDAHVDQHIFEKVLGPKGLLASKTVLMATHGIHHLAQFEHVVLVSNGAIVEDGSYKALMKKKGAVFDLVQCYAQATGPSSPVADQVMSPTLTSPTGSVFRDVCEEAAAAAGKHEGPTMAADDDTQAGTLDFGVYLYYFRLIRKPAIVLLVVMMICGSSFFTLTSYWLLIMSNSAQAAASGQPAKPMTYYIAVYGVLIVLGFGSIVSYVLLLTVYIGIHASRILHQNLLTKVTRAPMSWFDRTPAGRILNRFSQDFSYADSAVPVAFLQALGCLILIVANIATVAISSPWTMVLLPVLGILVFAIQRLFLATNRELQRLDSSSSAPILQLFEESLHGLVTIRACGQVARCTELMQARIDRRTRAQYLLNACDRWLGVVLSSIALIGVLLALTRYTCEVEVKMVSIERIKQYIDIESEAAEHGDPVDAEWPAEGSIAFHNYSAQYAGADAPVLRDLKLHIKGGEKIGICGRTGAGTPCKSTITLALFRILEAKTGSIAIDGQDISKVGLVDLRSRLTIIPQDPVLVQGTVRSNLDPHGLYSDEGLWTALEHASMKDSVLELEGQLQAEVRQGGSNFSVGQRQLLTLASALIRKRRIVIFDEATSATDAKTDAIVQDVIRREFKDCTVLTIAHRIATIMDSDRILVLDQGQVAEFDAPSVLLAQKRSHFSQLAAAAAKK
ncbi:hypothetical protein RI367_001615 [Sorochytrium milnesiophthora]